MKTIFRWLGKKIKQSMLIRGEDIYPAELGRNGALDSDANLNFSVYNAIGGKVIEFRRYNKSTDKNHYTMYVISKDDDFGEKISKIATLESLKD